MNNRETPVLNNVSLLTEQDIYLFKQGRHFRLYDKLGAHLIEHDGMAGVLFALWAPNAAQVSVIGDFNGWDSGAHPLAVRADESGIWEGFVPGVKNGSLYKYHIVSNQNNYVVDKGDPFGFYWELPPKTASVVWDLRYEWKDDEWMQNRKRRNELNAPINVYEVHLGSWRRDPAEPARLLSCREIAPALARYVKEMGFSHVEFLPVMEHPFYGSWGYQTIGYFAPASRYGTCQDFMYLVEHLHREGIGVIFDWVPSHFPSDEYGLVFFDGTHLYEHADVRKGFHPDWKSSIFNYGRDEVRCFLISSATFWMDKYHADGLRVDAVASMLYLDYSRQPGQWIPNVRGGRENLEAISFLRDFNDWILKEYPDALTIAEESTSWPMVTRSTQAGGLGFSMKWNMGWMNDTLEYFGLDPVHRKYHQDKLTFSIWYAFSENFMLPLSHDEVVHGKGSLFGKMGGDTWRKFANLRLLLGYMYTHPGKKLLFMGDEFGQVREWNHDASLDWHLLDNEQNRRLSMWVRDLNRLYGNEPALYEADFDARGFEWIDFHDADKSVISYCRKFVPAQDAGTFGARATSDEPASSAVNSAASAANASTILCVCNFTPVPRRNYRVGIPHGGVWQEVLNGDAKEYGGSGYGNMGRVEASPASFYGKYDHSLSVTLPPLAIVIFKGSPDTREVTPDDTGRKA
jgi:1,4-alpha-glucan branching enzyme